MKILNIKSNKFKTFLKSINLLDGQRRGEVIFRRLFVLIAIGMLIYLLLLTFVGRKDEATISIDTAPEKVQAEELVVEDKEEWVDGDKVVEKSDGSVEVIPAEVFMSAEQLQEQDLNYQKAQKIETYLRVNRGNAPLAKHAEKFVEVANKYGLDYRLLPAISVMESEGGKKLFRPYNAWGWGKSGFANWKEGIYSVSKGLGKYYSNGLTTPKLISKYYCPPSADGWANKVQYVMNEISKQ